MRRPGWPPRRCAWAQQAGDGLAVGYAQLSLALISGRAHGTGTAEGLGHLDQRLDAVGDHPLGMHVRLLLLTNKFGALADLDRPGEALAVARRALVLAEQAGISSRVDSIRVLLANFYLEVGRWEDAITEAEQAAVGAERRGDPDAAARHLSQITSQLIVRPQNQPAPYLLRWAQAVLAEQRGDQAGAIAALRPGLAPGPAGRSSPNHYLVVPMLTRLARARGDEGIAAAAAEAAAQEPLPRKVATAGHCRGLLAGDTAPVLAAAYWDSAGQPLPRAAALEDAAALAAAAGDRAGAWAALAEARQLYAGWERSGTWAGPPAGCGRWG